MTDHFNPNPSPLDQLSAEDRARIVGWLEIHSTREVVEMVAKDPPEGMGIQTHKTTLRRLVARHRANTRGEDVEIARLLAKSDAANPVESATESIVSDWAFEIASSPRRKTAAFRALSRWVLKQRELEQREREIKLLTERLALDRETFEFNAARAALNHHAELGTVLNNDETDNEDKILQARAILFNRPASELPR